MKKNYLHLNMELIADDAKRVFVKSPIDKYDDEKFKRTIAAAETMEIYYYRDVNSVINTIEFVYVANGKILTINRKRMGETFVLVNLYRKLKFILG